VATTVVLFDLDDTLFDHWACTRAALASLRQIYPALRRGSADVLEREHARLLEELHLRVLAGRMTVDEARIERFGRLLAFAGESAAQEAAAGAAAAYRAAYLGHWRPVGGALELLRAVHARAATGVVTNNVASEQRQKIAACGFGPLLDTVVISEEAGVTKPDRRIFEIALERLGRPAADAVMLGDAWPTDIEGARAAGIRPIWFNRFGAPSPDPSVMEVLSLTPTSMVMSMLFPNPGPRVPSP
jgi:putative hydrolase of the HAD superfamily